MSRQQASTFQKSKTLEEKYLIGDEIGKGAYGRVHRGVNMTTGDFVAIKQVSLENILTQDLSSIMSEIELLKNLNHRNIVRYIGSFKSETHFYIVLEFVENGSLANIVKPNKFGPFPESLVVIYITQVLEGLVYLHEQGVIHRDIKGANILATKEGIVKLADFGVATKLTEADGDALSVVGTPYWMAPEVIEMSGVTTSADIWSVGCTVIELLTSVPPFYDLQPMSALFRIVKDDVPPLPDGLSPELDDFLRQCFRKDPKQRPNATGLLQHPWITKSRNQSGHIYQPYFFNASVLELTKDVDGAQDEQANESGQESGQESTSTSLDFDSLAKEAAKVDFGAAEEVALAAEDSDLTEEFEADADSGQSHAAGSRGTVELRQGRKVWAVDSASQGTAKGSSADCSATFQQYADSVEDKSLDDLIASSSGENDGQALLPLLQLKLASKQKAVTQKGVWESDVLAAKFRAGERETGNQEDVEASRVSSENELKLMSEVNHVLEDLQLSKLEDTILRACEQLPYLFGSRPGGTVEKAMLYQTIAPIMDLLDGENPMVLWAGLKLLNRMFIENVWFREIMCVAGLIPALLAFASAKRSRPEIRLEAARLIHQLCFGSSLTLQMLVGCRGLPVLVGFLEPDLTKYRELVLIGIDAMFQVLHLPQPSLKHNICLTLAKSGLCLRLVTTMHRLCGTQAYASPAVSGELAGPNTNVNIMLGGHLRGGVAMPSYPDASIREGSRFYDSTHLSETSAVSGKMYQSRMSQKDSPEREPTIAGIGRFAMKQTDKLSLEKVCLERAAAILLIISRGSPSVRTQFCSQSLLTRLLELLDHLDQESLLKLLECVKFLSMDGDCLEVLQKTDVIQKLVGLLSIREGPLVKQIHAQVLSALYSLCKINKLGQENAAKSGLIPHLTTIIQSQSPLRQFALPLLCDLAHSSRICRTLLVTHGAVELYLSLLEDPVWAPHALDALSMCLASDNDKRMVEKTLLKSDSLLKLVSYFRSCTGPTFLLILEPFLRMMTKSPRLNAALEVTGFMPALVARLDHQDAVVRLNLLKMIKAIYDNHSRPKHMQVEHDLPRKLKGLTEEKREGERGGGQVLVKQMASVLLRGLHVSNTPAVPPSL